MVADFIRQIIGGCLKQADGGFVFRLLFQTAFGVSGCLAAV
ncbi:hypothetical protein HMPREF9120_00179 [Neisseria sp. oral taxon 020 str. F0370]|nr:hypothetical protein HMPREF9120_00179 [Neisseria sp. oral taxon 020 str. F0370]